MWSFAKILVMFIYYYMERVFFFMHQDRLVHLHPLIKLLEDSDNFLRCYINNHSILLNTFSQNIYCII